MQLSIRSDTAIRLMLYLAAQENDRWVTIHEISEAVIAKSTSLQVLCNDLHHAGLIETVRGRFGGARLFRSPEDIRIAEIIAVGESESGWKFSECDRHPTCECFLSGRCKLGVMYEYVQKQVVSAFESFSLADLMSTETTEEARRRARSFLGQATAALH